MADVIRARSLRGSSVVVVVKGSLLVSGDELDQIIGGLVSDVRVLLQENGVLADFIGDLVLGVLGVLDTEGHVSVESAGGWGFGVAVPVVGRWGVMQGGVSMVGWAMVDGVGRVDGESDREGHEDGSKLKIKSTMNWSVFPMLESDRYLQF